MATILRTGEQLTTSAAALKEGKTYHHTVQNARFIMPDGLAIIFMGGVFTTADTEIIAELDRVADRPASQIYTKLQNADSLKADAKRAAADAITS